MVPYDVLVDPLSLPSHPVIQERENVLDILYGEPEDSSAAYDSGGEQVRITFISFIIVFISSQITEYKVIGL